MTTKLFALLVHDTPPVLHLFKTEAEREQGTFYEIYDHAEVFRADNEDLCELRESGQIDFEGDPSLEWLTVTCGNALAVQCAATPNLLVACRAGLNALGRLANITDETRLGWAMQEMDAAIAEAEGRC